MSTIKIGLALWALSLGGCGALMRGPVGEVAGEAAKQMVEQAMRPAIEEILTTLDAPKNKALLSSILADLIAASHLREAARNMGDGMMAGVLDAVTEPSRQARLGGAASRFVSVMSAALAAGLELHLGPAMARTLDHDLAPAASRAMQMALEHVLSDEVSARAEAFATGLSRGIIVGLSRGMKEDLLPALTSSLAGSDGGVLLATLGEAARVTAKNAIVGLDDGLIEITRASNAGERASTLLSRLNDTTGAGLSLFLVLAIGAGLLFAVGLLLWLGVRRGRSHALERDTALRLLLGVIDAGHREKWGPSLDAALETALDSESDAERLRKLMHALRSGRVGLPRKADALPKVPKEKDEHQHGPPQG